MMLVRDMGLRLLVVVGNVLKHKQTNNHCCPFHDVSQGHEPLTVRLVVVICNLLKTCGTAVQSEQINNNEQCPNKQINNFSQGHGL